MARKGEGLNKQPVATPVATIEDALQHLAVVIKKLNRHLDLDEMLHQALPLICDLVGSPSGWIALRNPQGNFYMAAAYGLPPALKARNQAALRWGPCTCQRLLLSGDLTRAVNIVTCERLQKAKGDRWNLSNHASIPLTREGQPIGIINLVLPPDRKAFSDSELSILTVVGEAMAMAVHRLGLVEEIRATQHKTQRSLIAVLEGTDSFVGLADARGLLTFLNGAARQALLKGEADISRLHIADVFSEAEAQQGELSLRRGISQALKEGTWSGETELLTAAGRQTPVWVMVTAHPAPDGTTEFISILAHDITESKAAQQEQQRQLAIIEESPEFIFTVDARGRIIYRNRAARQLWGSCSNQQQGEARLEASYPRWAARLLTEDGLPLAERTGLWSGEAALLSREGKEIPVLQTIVAHKNEHGDVDYFSVIAIDNSQRKEYEAHLAQMTVRDPLTGLLNRLGFQQEMERLSSQLKAEEGAGALMYIDLDNFKAVNDTLGHEEGDKLLQRCALSMRHVFDDKDIVARVGGDEFAVFLPGADDVQARQQAARLLKSVAGGEMSSERAGTKLTLSIGIALSPDHGKNMEQLLRQADLAMYESKSAGGNLFTLYSPGLTAKKEIVSRAAWLQRLRHALQADRFQLHRQPIVDLRTNEVVFYELLLRLTGDDGNLIPPGEFLPVAAQSDVMADIDLWVVKEALKIIQAAQTVGKPQKFTVNLSGKSFSNVQFIAALRHELEKAPVDLSGLVFEITEQAAIGDVANARRHILQLQNKGCRFALDDFGVGYACFDLLKQLPVEFIKIDGSFIQNLLHDPLERRLLKLIIQAVRELGKQSIAEFIETPATAELLRQYGVQYGQGYYLGRPEPVQAT